ncbi:Phospholipid-transporting ATPase 1, partial [Mucuna pruriens]
MLRHHKAIARGKLHSAAPLSSGKDKSFVGAFRSLCSCGNERNSGARSRAMSVGKSFGSMRYHPREIALSQQQALRIHECLLFHYQVNFQYAVVERVCSQTLVEMYSSFSENGKPEMAIDLFRQMGMSGAKFDCLWLPGLVDEGIPYFRCMIGEGGFSSCGTNELNKDIRCIEYQGESPDEQALISATSAYGYTLFERTSGYIVIDVNGEKLRLDVLGLHEFDSVRKRTSVVIRFPDNVVKVLVKGADTSMFSILENGSESNDNIWHATQSHLNEYSFQGLRTFVIASSPVASEFDGLIASHQTAHSRNILSY